MLGILDGLIHGYSGGRRNGGVVKKPNTYVRRKNERAKKETTNYDDDDDCDASKEYVLRMYRAAMKEFAVENIFSQAQTSFSVGEGGGGEDNEQKATEKEKAEHLLMRRGNAVVSKWEARVMVPKWEENMDALEENRQ